jgi:peptidoglycan/xylan/chitin deacetylase (PgdA/CDA1 family)
MILMYHNIGEKAGFNTVSLDELKRQIVYIKDNFTVLNAEDYIKQLDSEKENVLITIDDAYTSFIELFYPVLKELNLPALLFVPSDHVGKYNVWDTKEKIRIMGWNSITEISNENLVEIGSHGRSHKRLSGLSESEVISEFIDSKNEIYLRTAKPVRYFSYPFGQINDYSQFSVKKLKECGYDAAFSTRYGISNRIEYLYELRRIEVEPKDDLNTFKKKCECKLHIKLLKRYIKENLIRAGIL